ncbi:D-lyxose/D-mannose family sugar isomerase [Shimia sp. SK013]|uniref:D-lyxose/D-mannose family sugar isomerase n=1 Tax=Shimia sp. SK013 TaxID=1389006 RepID=UPI0006B4EF99|nr:D-lyxose/D-mannose family sugar isomerase [Shimia sp. SK013]
MDITNCETGNIEEMGLFLFELRNGLRGGRAFGFDDASGFAVAQGRTVWCDGIRHACAAGEILRLAPGDSVTLMEDTDQTPLLVSNNRDWLS